jgi:hypothetical protein
VKTFANAEWFHIKDRGDVASVRSEERIQKVGDWQKEHFSEAMIDGVIYKIKGVGSYAIDHISIGHPIGLLVEGGRRSASDAGVKP